MGQVQPQHVHGGNGRQETAPAACPKPTGAACRHSQPHVSDHCSDLLTRGALLNSSTHLRGTLFAPLYASSSTARPEASTNEYWSCSLLGPKASLRCRIAEALRGTAPCPGSRHTRSRLPMQHKYLPGCNTSCCRSWSACRRPSHPQSKNLICTFRCDVRMLVSHYTGPPSHPWSTCGAF